MPRGQRGPGQRTGALIRNALAHFLGRFTSVLICLPFGERSMPPEQHVDRSHKIATPSNLPRKWER